MSMKSLCRYQRPVLTHECCAVKTPTASSLLIFWMDVERGAAAEEDRTVLHSGRVCDDLGSVSQSRFNKL